MEAEALHANKKAMMETERKQLLDKIEKLKERDRVRANLRQVNNPMLGGESSVHIRAGNTTQTVKLKSGNSTACSSSRKGFHNTSVSENKFSKYEPVRSSSRRGPSVANNGSQVR
jgi:hypothetical protein